MGISGTLRTMGLADLMQWVFHSQKTGTLIIQGFTAEKRIFFDKGYIISTTSSDPREYLGQFLLSYGYITEEELFKAMDVQQQSNILLGKILVMIGAISSTDLQKLMRIKAEESLYEIFLWEEGEFTFVENLLPEIKMVPLHIEPSKIIMEGVRRSDEWNRIREVIPSVKTLPIRQPGGDETEIDTRSRMILSHVDGKHTIADIALLSRSSEFHASQVLYHLSKKGIVSFSTPPEILTAEAQKRKRGTEIDEGELEIHHLITKSGILLKKEQWGEAWEMVRKAQTLKPDDLTVEDRVERAQTLIISRLEEMGLRPDTIPYLLKPLEELTNISITPKEGFLLTRINGSWDIKDILNVAPMHVVDAYLVFLSLERRGIIGLRHHDEDA